MDGVGDGFFGVGLHLDSGFDGLGVGFDEGSRFFRDLPGRGSVEMLDDADFRTEKQGFHEQFADRLLKNFVGFWRRRLFNR